MKKTEEMGISGKELVDYMKKSSNREEFAERCNEDCNEFVKDVETLTNSIGNLYEASKIPLAMGGVVVKVEITGAGKLLFEASIGNAGTSDMIGGMLKRIVEEL